MIDLVQIMLGRVYYNLDLRYETRKKLGVGGFTFWLDGRKANTDYAELRGRECSVQLEGKFVNCGRFSKNELYCKIGVLVYPSQSGASDGCIYYCHYKTELKEIIYSKDVEELVIRLVSLMRTVFDYCPKGEYGHTDTILGGVINYGRRLELSSKYMHFY